MDDCLAGFIRRHLKTTCILFCLLFFIPESIAESDYLLQIMQNSWTNSWPETTYNEEKYNEVSEVYSVDSGDQYANGEHYSWDNLYLDPYENTEIIIDPYE